MHPLVLAISCIFALFTLAVIVLRIRDSVSDAIWRHKNPPAKLASDHAAYFKRVASPDWQFYERYLQRPVPEVLQEAFKSQMLISEPHYFSDIYVTLVPIDKASEDDYRDFPGVIPFAESDGDPIYLKPGASEANAVYIAYHDGGDTDELSPGIESFLSELNPA